MTAETLEALKKKLRTSLIFKHKIISQFIFLKIIIFFNIKITSIMNIVPS